MFSAAGEKFGVRAKAYKGKAPASNETSAKACYHRL